MKNLLRYLQRCYLFFLLIGCSAKGDEKASATKTEKEKRKSKLPTYQEER